MNKMSTPPPQDYEPFNAPRPGLHYVLAPYPEAEDEISLLDLWRTLVRYKRMIVSVVLLSAAVATTAAFLLTPQYRAEVLMAPVAVEGNSASGTLANQFSGLASLAGMSVGSGGDTERALATLRSRAFITEFIKKENLLPILFARQWDHTQARWKAEYAHTPPTELDGYEYFKKLFKVLPDKKSGLVTLSIEWHDPERAAAWANTLVERINSYEKRVAIEQAERSITYLKGEVNKVSVLEIRQTIYHLIEGEMKKIMLANTRDQFAFRVIDPAVVPQDRIKPQRKLMVIMGVLLGLMLGVFMALGRSALGRLQAASDK